MSVKVKKILEKLQDLAPDNLAEDWDNIGLQVGSIHNKVSKILLALDATQSVIEEAINIGAHMIITHHPMIFTPIKKVTKDEPIGNNIYKLIQNNISLYVMHTNLDATFGGTNDVLGNIIGLYNVEGLSPNERGMGIGRIGDIKTTTITQLTHKLKQGLNISYARIVGSPEKEVNKVAICTGSGMSFLEYAVGRADVFITGDVKFHEAQNAWENHIGVIDVGHYGSENIVMPKLKEYMREFMIENNVEIVVSQINGDPFNII